MNNEFVHSDWTMHDVMMMMMIIVIMLKDINFSIFRLLKMLNLQQIGRNYYNPSDPVSIPNHRSGRSPWFSEGAGAGAAAGRAVLVPAGSLQGAWCSCLPWACCTS